MKNTITQKQEILNTMSIMTEAWDNADAELFSSIVSKDADYVTFNGQHLKGREEIAKAHDDLWQGFLKGSSLYANDKPEIRFITDELAIVHATGAVKKKWEKKPSGRSFSINTDVFVKTNGKWEITAFHNTRISKLPWFVRLLMKLKKG